MRGREEMDGAFGGQAHTGWTDQANGLYGKIQANSES